jgi:tRNA A37 threonylcarbamoyladenosine modification protein TsaB
VRTASSLLVQAAGALPPATGVVLGVRDALRGELYGGVYRLEPGAVTTLLPPVVAAPEALAARVTPLGVRAVVGEAPEPVLAALHQRLGAERLAPPAAGAPVLLGLLAREGGTAPVHDLRHWEPEYGRPAEAQRRWEERHGRPLPPAAGESR